MLIICVIVSYPGGGIFKLPMSHRIEIDPEDINITFNDVKGASNIYFIFSMYFVKIDTLLFFKKNNFLCSRRYITSMYKNKSIL